MDGETLDVPLPTGANISLTSLVTSSTSGTTNGDTTPDGTRSSTPSIKITSSRSEEYQHRLAQICSRATVDDPLNVIFQRDKTGSSTHVTTELLYPAARARIETKVKAGASVVEAADFAAVVCWEPPEATAAHPDLSESELEEIGRARPIFASFIRQMQEVRIRTLGRGQAYWNMSLMARDPDRKDKGVVRAVIEPYVERARREGVPIWLCAANERARDVYEYFGFRTVGITWSYLDVEKEKGEGNGQQMGVPTWCMICNWPVDKTKTVMMERNGMLEC
ncbi:hypothetical protein LTS15_002898 [Exophiala xenobiotica]|nr:hypothetical protein LTS15_002898 [Exophiala xenobiotica]